MRPTFIMLFSCFIRFKSYMQQLESCFIILRLLKFPCHNSFWKIWYIRFLPSVRDFFIWNKFGYNSFREKVHLSILGICFEETKLHFSSYSWLQKGLIWKPMSEFVGISNCSENNFWCSINYYVFPYFSYFLFLLSFHFFRRH